jgi:hypothetical protein
MVQMASETKFVCKSCGWSNYAKWGCHFTPPEDDTWHVDVAQDDMTHNELAGDVTKLFNN